MCDFCFFKQKTAYEMRISDRSSDVCSSDLNAMHEIGGFDERALLGKIAKALDASRGMGKEETRPVDSGVTVRTISFERLVQDLAGDHQLFVMARKGPPIRDHDFASNPCILLTDPIPLPKNTFPRPAPQGAPRPQARSHRKEFER